MTRKKNSSNFNSNKTYWQTYQKNQDYYRMYRDWILSLAMNRYRWVNLPSTCDARYLEYILCMQGVATIAKAPDLNVWVSTMATNGKQNIYDDPINWRSVGNNGWNFLCDSTNGVLIWDNVMRYPILKNIDIWARKLANYDSTIDANLEQQKVPYVFTAPQEKVNDLTQIIKQAYGGEPAILGYKGIETIKADILVTPVEFKGEQLQAAKERVFNEIYTFLGINNVDRKSERMIEAEVMNNNDPTDVRALDGLQCRRRAADYLNQVFGLNIKVYWNEDNESDNYNTMHNIQKYGDFLDKAGTPVGDDENGEL